MYIGVGIMSDALMPWLQLIALLYFVFQYVAIVSIEEKYLERTFESWEDYSSNVPRFIPRVSKYEGVDMLVANVSRAFRSERSSLLALSSSTVLLLAIYILKNIA